MANQIDLYSISEILEYNFFIPSYQRGYRWTSQQVTELLEDVYAFALKDKHKKEFYCLQPVVVKAVQQDTPNGRANFWEVVDGQQRLTTINILLRYLVNEHLRGSTLKEDFGKDLFTLIYETRPESADFLLTIGEKRSDSNIDYYYMSAAYDAIHKWFNSKPKKNDVRQAILSTLTHDRNDQRSEGIVQIIWYEIEPSQNPIDTFIRINLGKIPLTSAELIKALFLQERNFGTQNEIGVLRQMEIAREWDQMENKLQNDEFWWFLNKEKNDTPSRIALIFDLMCKVATDGDDELLKTVGTDKFSTFRYFNQLFEQELTFSQLQNLWQKVKDYFMTFEEWFNDPTWYHYIGFLVFCGDQMNDLYDLTKKHATKKAITTALVGRIADQLKEVKWATDAQEPYLNLTYPKDDRLIKQVLLLFNLVPIVQQSEKEKLIYKFPFKAFKKDRWDTEHIDAYQSRNMKKRKDQLEWLEFAIDDLREILKGNPLLDEVADFMANASSRYSFDHLLEQITQASGEETASEDDETLKNNIGNLTLLNAYLNRSYGNALFPTKRRRIIAYDAVGDFMPMNTKNVFLKYYDQQGKSRSSWSRTDIEKYRSVIGETLKDFIAPKPVIHEQV
ncbi:uncharacterized protein with ParB-like and HNH nuclease domain [Mucilaginibacter rubeus]|uniref:DUF262 domain-containing protein n=1 Tax=Mucilaginibacter rubeus TaxID=2027860 RepID=UPI0033912511